jgi:hypothetical protein
MNWWIKEGRDEEKKQSCAIETHKRAVTWRRAKARKRRQMDKVEKRVGDAKSNHLSHFMRVSL